MKDSSKVTDGPADLFIDEGNVNEILIRIGLHGILLCKPFAVRIA